MHSLDTYDVCVIGSGPAGAFAANILARNRCAVAVIEAGGAWVNSRADAVLDESASTIAGGVRVGLSQQIGGSSNLWAGFAARLNPIDFLARPQIGAPGWPITNADLDPYYLRLDHILGLRRDAAPNRDLMDECFAGGGLQAHETIILDPPFVTTGLVQKQDGIEVLTCCAAHRLIWNEQRMSIDALEYLHKPTGQRRRLNAGTFILAAGTLTNIPLLLYSLAERRDRLPKVYKRIGKGFSTHPKANVGTLKLNKKLPGNHPLICLETLATHRRRYQFGLREHVLREKGLLNHCVRFELPGQSRLFRAFETAKRAIYDLAPANVHERRLATQAAGLGRRVYSAIDNMSVRNLSPDRLSVRLFLDQAVRLENRLTLSARLSESGLPLAAVNWRFSEEDWQNAEAFVREIASALAELQVGTLHYERPALQRFMGLHSHFLGGTPMGTSPDTSVVDAQLKVHGIDNLYVSGPSVFPTYGYANPFCTIAALSIRLGEHLTRARKSREKSLPGQLTLSEP